MIKPEWLQFFTEPPKQNQLVQSWDISMQYPHKTCCLTIDDHKNKSYVLDSRLFRTDNFNDCERTISMIVKEPF